MSTPKRKPRKDAAARAFAKAHREPTEKRTPERLAVIDRDFADRVLWSQHEEEEAAKRFDESHDIADGRLRRGQAYEDHGEDHDYNALIRIAELSGLQSVKEFYLLMDQYTVLLERALPAPAARELIHLEIWAAQRKCLAGYVSGVLGAWRTAKRRKKASGAANFRLVEIMARKGRDWLVRQLPEGTIERAQDDDAACDPPRDTAIESALLKSQTEKELKRLIVQHRKLRHVAPSSSEAEVLLAHAGEIAVLTLNYRAAVEDAKADMFSEKSHPAAGRKARPMKHEKRALAAIDHLGKPSIMSDIQAAAGMKFATAKNALNALLKQGRVQCTGTGRKQKWSRP